MTGNLDAFCERCGKTAAPALPATPPGGQNGLRRFLRGTRPVRVEPDPATALRLCLGCRGYICAECWNVDAAVCQTCQPLAGVGVSVQSDVTDEPVAPGLEIVDDAPPADDRSDSAWPASDLFREQLPALAPGPIAEPDATVAEFEQPATEPVAELEPVAEFESVAEFEPVAAEPGEPVAAEPEEPVAEFEAVAEFKPAAEFEPAAAPMEGAEDDTGSAVDAFEDRWIELLGRVQAVGAASAREAPAAASEAAADVPQADVEPVADAASEIATSVESSPAPAETLPAGSDEDLWAAVLLDSDSSPAAESPEPDANELTRVLQPRRNRRRAGRPLPRRPLRPETAAPPAQPPTMTFVADVPAEPAGPPPPPRVPKLPPALPPRPPAATQPWPMPTPPGFLPPPPPPTLTTIQPAPARFRLQVIPVELPKPPATKACGNCGLELSAKVMFCRRCGTRQPESA